MKNNKNCNGNNSCDNKYENKNMNKPHAAEGSKPEGFNPNKQTSSQNGHHGAPERKHDGSQQHGQQQGQNQWNKKNDYNKAK